MTTFKRRALATACLAFCTALNAQSSSQVFDRHSITLLPEFRPIGGVGNNLQHPELNATVGAPERNLAPLNFAAGTVNGLAKGPNPRLISNVIAGGVGAQGQDAETPDPVASAWVYVFGQFVDHDLDLESTPPSTEPIPITIPANDPLFPAGSTIAMNRDIRSPVTNTITNATAGNLDLSQLYGSTDAVAQSLRNPDGTLKSSDGGLELQVVNGVFVAGDPRVMENPELSAVTILFMREHNFWVQRCAEQNPQWTGDQLYNMAKAITTAEYQNIIYEEFLPVLIGRSIGPYRGYRSTVSAQVSQEFSTAAFRVGHSQVSDTQEGVDSRGATVFVESLAQAFFNTAEIDVANGINPLLRGLALDSSNSADVYTVAVLRNLLFAPLVGGDVDAIDLIAIDIQRERDVGIASLNQTRRALNLRPYRFFAELTADPVLQQSFQDVYGSIDAVDLFMGGLAEAHPRGSAVGSTFQAIIAEQFEALRSGDRFFWRNQAFDAATAREIGRTRLSDILARNADIVSAQPLVFVVAPLPRHVHHHAQPGNIDNHGR